MTGYEQKMADLDREMAPTLVEWIASRLAHEIVGPIGAISNGLELLSELGPNAGEDVHQLISGSAEAASARLTFYRLAYGRAGYGVTNAAQLRGAASAFFAQTPRHDLSWPLPPILPSLSDGVGRLVLLLCEVAVDLAPRGGLVSVSLEEDGAQVTVTATDEAAELPPGIVSALTDPRAHLSAEVAHAALAQGYAQRIGWRIMPAAGDGKAVLQAVQNHA